MSNPLAIVLNNCSFDCAMPSKNPEKVPLQQIKSADEVELTEANIHTKPVSCGWLIINADDWGRDDHTTNRILAAVGGAPPTAKTQLQQLHQKVR
jgi:hypothetical protein